MSKKHVLIITYYWPPAGGPGVQRWMKFCKYLPEHDIIPIVYCPENPTYPIIDESMENEVPESIEVIKSIISEPYKIARLFSKRKTKSISSGIISNTQDQSFIERLLLFIRGNLFIPDARKQWVKPSVQNLSSIIEQRNINCIITTGPPHSLHLIGLGLKHKLDMNWIADFRDPWTTIGYHKSLKLLPGSAKKHKNLESKVLNSADQIIVTSNTTKVEFEKKTNKPITVITNGYDNHNVSVQNLDSVFSISHIGSLLSNRNPSILWEVLAELSEELTEFKEQLQLNLVGVTSQDIVDDIKSYGLKDNLNIIGYVSHQEAIRYQLKSQLLLLIEINSEDTKAIIPGKLFEYLQSDRPIIAIGPEGSDVESIIVNTNSGNYFNYNSKENLKAFIYNSFVQFKKGELKNNAIGLKKYSRRELTRQLAFLLNKYL